MLVPDNDRYDDFHFWRLVKWEKGEMHRQDIETCMVMLMVMVIVTSKICRHNDNKCRLQLYTRQH